MAINKMANGFYSFSDSYLKSMRKQDLINYIRTIEKNWQNSLITNDIQYTNCKRLLEEERNKAIDELKNKVCIHFADWKYSEDDKCVKDIIELASESVEEIAEQMKAGGINE